MRRRGHVYNQFHEVTVVVAIIQVRIKKVGIRATPGMGIGVVRVTAQSVSRRVASSGVTYFMLVTLLTSHAPMSWLNCDASKNMRLYADAQHTEEKREGGRTLRQVTVHGSSEWVRC